MCFAHIMGQGGEESMQVGRQCSGVQRLWLSNKGVHYFSSSPKDHP